MINFANIMNKFTPLVRLSRLLEYRPITTRINADGKDVPKKKNFENRITLIGTDNSVSITDLKNAQNLSVKRELKLVKIQDVDAKTRRPIYKLMTNIEFHEEEIERRSEKQANRQSQTVKGQKLLTLSTRIGEHDLMTNVKKMTKLLEKKYEVKVVLTGEEGQSQVLERMYLVIEKNIQAFGKVVQKRTKGNSLRFQLLPHKENNDTVSNESEPNKNESKNSESNNDNKGPL